MEIKKIAVYGTFDVDNYGDLLFPHIAQYRLENYNLEFVSPTENNSVFNDAKKIISFEESIKKKYSGVLIGGGNILHLKPNINTVYKTHGFSYADLWIGAIKYAAENKLPSLYNSPGIPQNFKSEIEKKIAHDAFLCASYISFREVYSKKIAEDLFQNEDVDINVVPDTALEISKIWPINNQFKEDYITVNLNSRYHNPIEETAKWIDKIASKYNSKIILVVIGDCHGDLTFTHAVAKKMISNYEIHKSDNLKEIAHCIGKSKLFIGSSMHGFITALSYKTPAFLVLNEKPAHKFLGLYEICDLELDSLCSSFYNCYLNLTSPAILSTQAMNNIERLLDEHWNNIKYLLESEKFTKRTQNILKYRQLLDENQRKNKYHSSKTFKYRLKRIIKKILKIE